MQTFPLRPRRPATALRTIVFTLATAALAPACRPDAPLPTEPRVTSPVAPYATVVGASVVELPSLGGSETVITDNNDAGQVVGYAYTYRHAFLWTPGQGMRDLGTLGGPTSQATAVNNTGQVVGLSDLAWNDPFVPTGLRHAFLWTSSGGMQDLGSIGQALGESGALDINDAGQIVGYSREVPNGGYRPFVWTPDAGMRDLGSLGGPIVSATAWGINNAGQVVGQLFVASHAFLWTPGEAVQDLGTLGGNASGARGINDAGQVVGWSYISPTAPYTSAFLFTPGKGMRDLGTFGGPTEAYDINDAGQVVGVSGLSRDPRAFLWTVSEGMEDLSHITGLTRAVGINNNGQVVGNNRVASLEFLQPNRAPVANAGGPYIGHKKKPVAFDGRLSTDPDGDALTFSWRFGDDSPLGSGATPVHAYETWGTYTVTLTISDAAGLSATSTTTAVIAPPGQLRDTR